MRLHRSLCTAPAAVLLALVLLPAAAAAQAAPRAEHFQRLELRDIGPATMSGRIVDLAVIEDGVAFYVASSTGGIWKTVDGGVTFEAVFRDEATHSVGAMAVHPRDTSVVWVGTGERANRQSTSWGDGVYRSTDGGRSWTNVGLRDSKHIGRIVLHPTDTNVAYVAAMGHLWGPNEERGLYVTRNGGASWDRLLYVDEGTGVVDVAMDPSNPNTLLAATYQRRRSPWGFHGGGPGSGIWKSTDGGAHWTPITAGLPAGELGRIGLAYAPSQPNVVYASVEQGVRYNASTAYEERRAGVYRSTDGGETWSFRSDWNPRPMYASQPYVDPNDADVVYMQNSFSRSEDGGLTFQSIRNSLHGDDRFVWVDPADSDHLMKADDGGLGISWDRGGSFLYLRNLPVSQWYRVALDNAVPFNVYGGLQDNGSWMGPSATYRSEGILWEDWLKTGGGDGFLSLPDTTEPRIYYTESQYLGLVRHDAVTGETKDIRPGDPHGAIGGRRNWLYWGEQLPEPELENAMAPANWDGPYLISPHDPRTLYAGTNELWVSADRGDTWRSLGDMTTGVDRRDLTLMGQRPDSTVLSLDDGIPYWPTLSIIEESPLVRGLLYVGTDDGQLRVSRDGGASWEDAHTRMPGLPAGAWANGAEASRHEANTAYVVFNNYRNDDYANYLYRSRDAGRSWQAITGDLPAERVLRTVREDPRNADVLWLGTELGLFVTVDGGARWTELRANLPTVAVNDLRIHPRDNDLVLATHGRGVWILDDVNAIQEMSPAVLASPAHLFTAEPGVMLRYEGQRGHEGDMIFRGENPPSGAILQYWLGEGAVESDVSLSVHDASGTRVAGVEAPGGRGVHRVTWDMRHEAEGGRGPLVAPGSYTVRLAAGGVTAETPLQVREDPRVTVSAADRQAWTEWQLRIGALRREAAAALRPLAPRAQEARRVLAGESVAGMTRSQAEAIAEVARRLGELANRAGGLERAVAGWTGLPTADQRSMFAFLQEQLAVLAPRAAALAGG